MLPMDPKEVLKQRAAELGFDLVGVAPVKPGRDLEFARAWVGRGYGGEMAYLANPKRFDLREVLPSVKSVICVGLIYDTQSPFSTEVGEKQKPEVRSREPGGIGTTEGENASSNSQSPVASFESPVSNFQFPVSPAREGARAWVSRYAWGRDYHEIMREKLERLRAAIENLAPGIETRVYVDTGPVIERAFARFSGLGWMGKNTCVINKEKGSWFFLGVILTSLELEPDLPAPDRCGSCRACLDACPTGALVEPYVMDASRCISYLTIELKGSIPLELRPGVGVNIFGCDICQDVCPWNRRSQKSEVRSQESSFQPMAVSYQRSAVSSQPSTANQLSSIQNPPDTRHPIPDTFSLFAPPLEALAAMTKEDFRKTFAHSPIKRAKYRGWLRNLCVAMGNSGDARFIQKLREFTTHPDTATREHAEWALGLLALCAEPR